MAQSSTKKALRDSIVDLETYTSFPCRITLQHTGVVSHNAGRIPLLRSNKLNNVL